MLSGEEPLAIPIRSRQRPSERPLLRSVDGGSGDWVGSEAASLTAIYSIDVARTRAINCERSEGVHQLDP